MKFLLISIALIAFIFFIKACRISPKKEGKDIKKNSPQIQPTNIANDKIVVIRNARYTDVSKAARQFCFIYNKEDKAAILNLIKVSENETVITFPYNVTFDIFCFFINYMYYPENIKYSPDIKCWVTTKTDDIWITDKTANKKVMLFIPPDDKEYDNVYLTTEDNIGYKLGFAAGEECKFLNDPKMRFLQQTINLDSIKNKQIEEIN